MQSLCIQYISNIFANLLQIYLQKLSQKFKTVLKRDPLVCPSFEEGCYQNRACCQGVQKELWPGTIGHENLEWLPSSSKDVQGA